MSERAALKDQVFLAIFLGLQHFFLFKPDFFHFKVEFAGNHCRCIEIQGLVDAGGKAEHEQLLDDFTGFLAHLLGQVRYGDRLIDLDFLFAKVITGIYQHLPCN